MDSAEIDEQVRKLEENSEKFKIAMRVNGTITIFAFLMSMYLIIYKSSEHMKTYKLYLLNIVVSSSSFNYRLKDVNI